MQAILIERGLAERPARSPPATADETARARRRPAPDPARRRHAASTTRLRAFGRRNLPLRAVPGARPTAATRADGLLPLFLRQGRGRRTLALHRRGARSVPPGPRPGRAGGRPTAEPGTGGPRPRPDAGDVTELHEVRTLNKWLDAAPRRVRPAGRRPAADRSHRRRAAAPVRPPPRRRGAPAARPPRAGRRRSASSARRGSRSPGSRAWARWTPSSSGRPPWTRPGGPCCRSARGRRRRQRPVHHPDGRRRRAPPRVHREARAGGQEPRRVSARMSATYGLRLL